MDAQIKDLKNKSKLMEEQLKNAQMDEKSSKSKTINEVENKSSNSTKLEKQLRTQKKRADDLEN